MFFHKFSSQLVKGRKIIFPALPSLYCCIQKASYVDVKMKWKKDGYYDSIEAINYSRELKAVISLKNCMIKEPDYTIPISAISKSGDELDVPIKVAKFLRQYPSFFEEFAGEKYNLPWFRLTREAINLDEEEQAVYENKLLDLVNRLKSLVLMSEEKMLPVKIIQGMQWYLGLSTDFLQNILKKLDGTFEIAEMDGGLPAIRVIDDNKTKIFSQIQKNAVKRYEQLELSSNIAFPLFPSKGLRLKQKISDWLDEFQELPYVSPYEDSSLLNPNSDISEKRVVGVLHELLSLFVDYSAERKKLLCLRKYLSLPQKFYRAFERHPHIFYLSLKNKTCTAILKEAYNAGSCIEEHPMLAVRKKYIALMKKSDGILKERRRNKPLLQAGNVNLSEPVDPVEAKEEGTVDLL
ncbi:protein WHAT'S THIS FACTOR 9, mitochondrial [Aristolochia californica]|uniref:protein WHAT'S THIS FACTOR 9, mitochondrial n=1 Tax=Aristolochia californica TaxID=171875 RepID=UPI0035D912AC